MDTVFVEHLTLAGRHGVSESERSREQDFIFDIETKLDARPASLSDDLADTVDYVDVVRAAREVTERSSFHLIETLAETVCARILQHPRVASASVTVRKPAALPGAMAGVTIARTRG